MDKLWAEQHQRFVCEQCIDVSPMTDQQMMAPLDRAQKMRNMVAVDNWMAEQRMREQGEGDDEDFPMAMPLAIEEEEGFSYEVDEYGNIIILISRS